MKKNLCLVLLVGSFVSVFCGFSRGNLKLARADHVPADELWLYNFYEDRLGIYDPINHTWKPMDVSDSMFQYAFDGENRFFTSGYSVDKRFSILEAEEGDLSVVYTVGKSECIYPLASDGGKHFYLLRNEAGRKKKREIITIENGRRNVIASTSLFISEGAVIKNNLYFTVYESEKDMYDLYRIDLSSEQKKYKLVKTGLVSGKLYTYQDSLYFSDDTRIFNGEREFLKKDYNFFIDEKDLLLQLSLNQDAEVVLTVTDLSANKVCYKYNEVINYEIKNGQLIVYCYNNIHRVNLK